VRTSRVAAVVLFSFLGAALISLYWHESDFAKDLRNSVAAASDGIELCNFRGEEVQDCNEPVVRARLSAETGGSRCTSGSNRAASAASVLASV
jgi:hypothetical protein